MEEERQQCQVLQALEALRAASKDIEINSEESGSMQALLELHTGSAVLFNNDPKLITLSSLLSRLQSLASSLKNRKSNDEISRVAGSIGTELQSWIDRKSIHRLISSSSSDDQEEEEEEEDKCTLLLTLQSRLSQGFDRSLQNLLLRSNVFSTVESLLADPTSSKKVRDQAASAVLAFVSFNKHVFVGEVLMRPTVKTLVSISSPTSIRVLNGLVLLIRSPLVDELHANGDIKNIVLLLSSKSDEIRVLAFETVLEIGYYGRKEAVDAMLEEGLIEILVELQRSEIEMDVVEEERHPFASCVSRFSIQLEVGEGLRQREKRAVKLEVLRRVREAVREEAEAATVLAEVLWGSTVW